MLAEMDEMDRDMRKIKFERRKRKVIDQMQNKKGSPTKDDGSACPKPNPDLYCGSTNDITTNTQPTHLQQCCQEADTTHSGQSSCHSRGTPFRAGSIGGPLEETPLLDGRSRIVPERVGGKHIRGGGHLELRSNSTTIVVEQMKLVAVGGVREYTPRGVELSVVVGLDEV